MMKDIEKQKQNINFGKSMGGISKGIGGAGKSAKKAKKAGQGKT